MDYKDNFPKIPTPVDLLERIEERDNLDYKTKLNDSSRQGKVDFFKDYAAMGNHGGGVFIYGVNGRERVGVLDNELAFYDPSRLHDKLKAHLSPVPKIICEIVEHKGLKFPFVKVAGIDVAPILISKIINDENNQCLACEGDFYVRQNTKTIKASSEAQVRHVFEQVITHQLRERLATLGALANPSRNIVQGVLPVEFDAKEHVRKILDIDPLVIPSRQVLLVPKDRHEQFSPQHLLSAFSNKVEINGFSFPHYGEDLGDHAGLSRLNDGLISWWGKNRKKNEFRCLGRVVEDGSFFWLGTLFEDDFVARRSRGSERFTDSVGVMLTKRFVNMALQFANRYIDSLGDSGIWSMEYRLCNVSGRKLENEDLARIGFFSRKVTMENNIKVRFDFKAVDLAREMEKINSRLIGEIFQRFNLASPNESQMAKDFYEDLSVMRTNKIHIP